MRRIRAALAAWSRLPKWARRLVALAAVLLIAWGLWRALESAVASVLGAAGFARGVARLARAAADDAQRSARALRDQAAADAEADHTFDDQLRVLADEGEPTGDVHPAGEGPTVPRSRFLRRLRR